MKSFLLLIPAALALVGCATSNPAPPSSGGPSVTAAKTVGDYQLGEPISEGNVTIVPVTLTKAPPDVKQDNTMTLAEAKKLGLVEIIEKPGQEEVNSLKVHNKGDRPLLLLGGELLIGGKQDRIVGKDILIGPGETRDVPVYCVEPGRWQGASSHFDYSGSMVPADVRKAATYGDQSEVWAKVGDYNKSAGQSNTGRTTVVMGMSAPQVQSSISEKLPSIVTALSREKNVVGVIFVLNGKIQTLDLFGNPRLFNSAHESLLKGFLAQAATAPDEKQAASMDACLKFLSDSVNSHPTGEADRATGGMAMDGDNVRGASLKTKDVNGTLSPLHDSFTTK